MENTINKLDTDIKQKKNGNLSHPKNYCWHQRVALNIFECFIIFLGSDRNYEKQHDQKNSRNCPDFRPPVLTYTQISAWSNSFYLIFWELSGNTMTNISDMSLINGVNYSCYFKLTSLACIVTIFIGFMKTASMTKMLTQITSTVDRCHSVRMASLTGVHVVTTISSHLLLDSIIQSWNIQDKTMAWSWQCFYWHNDNSQCFSFFSNNLRVHSWISHWLHRSFNVHSI